MRSYLTLDVVTIVLAIFGVFAFYKNIITLNILIAYFLIIALVYFILITKIHETTKNIMREIAKRLNCEFVEGGKYSLTHFIKCRDMEIQINLRGSYTPSSLHLIFYGDFHQADVRAFNPSSQHLINMLNEFQIKHKIKVNDAYVSKFKAEAIITRFPYDVDRLEKIIKDFRELILRV